MAIEPLSSAMTYQAQVTPQAKPVQKIVENTEVSTPEQTIAYDATIAKVKAADKADSQGQDNSGNNANQQQASNEQIKKAVEQLNKNMAHSTSLSSSIKGITAEIRVYF